jgi:hypothetical protein
MRIYSSPYKIYIRNNLTAFIKDGNLKNITHVRWHICTEIVASNTVHGKTCNQLQIGNNTYNPCTLSYNTAYYYMPIPIYYGLAHTRTCVNNSRYSVKEDQVLHHTRAVLSYPRTLQPCGLAYHFTTPAHAWQHLPAYWQNTGELTQTSELVDSLR